MRDPLTGKFQYTRKHTCKISGGHTRIFDIRANPTGVCPKCNTKVMERIGSNNRSNITD